MADPPIRQAYDQWAEQYDADENATRDLNGRILREQIEVEPGTAVLEVGCGTGLNTEWLVRQGASVVAADLSTKMLEKARDRLSAANVRLVQMDVTDPWPFGDGQFDAVVSTLVLEHVERLEPVFAEAHRVLGSEGVLFVSELHPYRQLTGTKANFRNRESGERVTIDAFAHSVSEFVNGGLGAGFSVERMKDWYGAEDEHPRLLSIRFRA